MTVSIRHATAEDQPHILSLARGERIKPTGLDWRRFVVAVDDGKIIGAVQLRNHPDGSRELGSLVVAPQFRGRGVAARLIEARLADAAGRVLVITGRALARIPRGRSYCGAARPNRESPGGVRTFDVALISIGERRSMSQNRGT